ncbi:hypothetical protein IU459_13185 [Nocardia amamiensis]|uniref:Abortive infection protein-like C-terminal domain-containing protein n=1 Tax=Nocardia amamiensis TaxID=404578 RepID=A0ABS0CPH4_9NOCA|nr:hypothetical protein [Nocardia amamiensis]MBF6298492.1 hypothetical protein [Nocardia amamiensis]
MTWTPLSQRTGRAEADGPFEGVPDHLHGLLRGWAEKVARGYGSAILEKIGLRLRVENRTSETFQAFSLVLNAFYDEQQALDLIDALLHYGAQLEPDTWTIANGLPSELRRILEDGGSVWTVSPEADRLVLVVDERVEEIYQQAVAVEDEATIELREAWANAYGRNGNASDAWDHAIKAVEDVLIPVVVPNKAKATLSDVLGQLRSPASSAQWKMMLPGADQTHDVAGFVGMLQWLWPNHDRHGGGGPRRIPSIDEARMIVTCAAMIVQWHRQGWIVARR